MVGEACVHDPTGEQMCVDSCETEPYEAACGGECCPEETNACVKAAGRETCIAIPEPCAGSPSCSCILEQMPELEGCVWFGG